MDLATIYQIIGMVGTIVSSGGYLWSRRAAKLSAPTANGFAGTVLTGLVRIETRLDTLETRLDNLDLTSDRPVPRQS